MWKAFCHIQQPNGSLVDPVQIHVQIKSWYTALLACLSSEGTNGKLLHHPRL